MSTGQEYQVNERPTSATERDLLPLLRSYGHTLNQLALGNPMMTTATLPAAGAAQNGKIIIEDAGGGTRNLIFYAGGLRYRVSGTAF